MKEASPGTGKQKLSDGSKLADGDGIEPPQDVTIGGGDAARNQGKWATEICCVAGETGRNFKWPKGWDSLHQSGMAQEKESRT